MTSCNLNGGGVAGCGEDCCAEIAVARTRKRTTNQLNGRTSDGSEVLPEMNRGAKYINRRQALETRLDSFGGEFQGSVRWSVVNLRRLHPERSERECAHGVEDPFCLHAR